MKENRALQAAKQLTRDLQELADATAKLEEELDVIHPHFCTCESCSEAETMKKEERQELESGWMSDIEYNRL